MKASYKSASLTPDMLAGVRKVGRPPRADALTAAQRQAKFRAARVQVNVGERMGETIRRFASEFDLSESDVCAELIRFALTNRNWSQTGF